jgi:hypothetical protein
VFQRKARQFTRTANAIERGVQPQRKQYLWRNGAASRAALARFDLGILSRSKVKPHALA